MLLRVRTRIGGAVGQNKCVVSCVMRALTLCPHMCACLPVLIPGWDQWLWIHDLRALSLYPMLGISGWIYQAWYLCIEIGGEGVDKSYGLGICHANRLADYELCGISRDLIRLKKTNVHYFSQIVIKIY